MSVIYVRSYAFSFQTELGSQISIKCESGSAVVHVATCALVQRAAADRTFLTNKSRCVDTCHTLQHNNILYLSSQGLFSFFFLYNRPLLVPRKILSAPLLYQLILQWFLTYFKINTLCCLYFCHIAGALCRKHTWTEQRKNSRRCVLSILLLSPIFPLLFLVKQILAFFSALSLLYLSAKEFSIIQTIQDPPTKKKVSIKVYAFRKHIA